MKKRSAIFITAAIFLLLSVQLNAQLSIVQTSTNYTIDFDNSLANVNDSIYSGLGFSPSPSNGQLNSNTWAASGLSDGNVAFGGTGTTGDFARGHRNLGSHPSTGGFYAFEVSTDNFAFGIQPIDADWTPGDIILKVKNNTGETITSIDLSYNILVYNDQGRSNDFNFSHSSDNSTYTPESSLDYASVEVADVSPVWVTVSRSITLSSLSIIDGDYYYLKWTGDDNGGSGSRDEFALDDIVINAYTGIVAAPSVQTEDPTNILDTQADFTGVIISSNGATVTDGGFYYSTSSGVTTSDTKVIATNDSNGEFFETVNSLSAETNYFYKAYAENSEGTTLADNEISFWTLSTEPAAHPSIFSAAKNGSTQIDLAFSAANTNADGYIILRKQGSSPTIAGVSDATAPGSLEFPEGTTLVTTITDNTIDVYNDQNLFGATQYFYLIIAYNWKESETSTYNYLTSGSPKTANATTDTEVNPPTNHVSAFTASTVNSSSISLSWTDDVGTTTSHGALILVNTSNSFSDPSDGTLPTDDVNLRDDVGNVVVTRGTQAYSWEGMKPETQYFFKIYPFTNNGGTVLYKTDGTVPTANATTTALSNPTLFITEISDASDNGRAKFVELYNGGATAIDFSSDIWYLSRQANAGSWRDIKLSGTLNAGKTMVISQRNVDFQSAFGISPNQTNFGISGNGNDGYFLYFGSGHEIGHIYDSYGVEDEDGTGKQWEYTNGKAVRSGEVTSPNSTWTVSEWEISMPSKVEDMTPGSYKETFTWAGSESTVWNTKGNNWKDATNSNGYVPDASTSVVIPNVANNPIVGSEAVCYSLSISSGAVLTVEPNKSLTVESSISNSGGVNGLVIKSSSAGTGSLLFRYGTPDAKVERWVENNAWHQVGCPTSGWRTSDFYDAANASWLTYFTESTEEWHYCLDTDSLLSKQQGFDYAVANSRVVEFTGALTAADQLIPLEFTATKGYNLIGNPFSSAIKWDAGWSTTNLEGSIWIWDNAYNGGNYRTVTTGGIGSINDNIIPVGQAFFVRATASSPSITIPESARDHYLQSYYKNNKSKVGKNTPAFVMLRVTKDGHADDIWVSFSENATDNFDNGWDASKLFANGAPGLFMPLNDSELAINTLPLLENGNEKTVGVSLNPSTNGEYTLKLYDSYKMNDVSIVLEDILNNTIQDLNVNSTYVFTGSQDDSPERFLLHFMYSPDGVNNTFQQESSIQIYSYNNNIYIRSYDQAISQSGEVFVYDMMGRKLFQKQIESGRLQKVSVDINSNYVVVKVIKQGIAKTEKVFIK